MRTTHANPPLSQQRRFLVDKLISSMWGVFQLMSVQLVKLEVINFEKEEEFNALFVDFGPCTCK